MAIFSTILSAITGYEYLVVIPAITLLALAVYQTRFAVRYPTNLPLAGEPEGRKWFTWRTRWRYYTDCGALYRETYERYTRNGKTVLLPGLGFRHDIIVPQSAMQWVLARPENELSHAGAILEVVQLKYGLGHERYKADPWPGMLVKTEINSMLEGVCADMGDELTHAFDRYFGSDTESWKEIDLLETIRLVVAQAASRFTVGLPLCRKEEYLRDCLKTADGIVLNGGLTGASPLVLRPIVGPIFSWKLRRNVGDIKRHFEPIYRQRLRDLEDSDIGDPEPQDLLQRMLRYAQKERPDELDNFDVMTKRLCFANFAAMHQTGILVTNMLLNIIGSDARFNTISVLRDEVTRIIGTGHGCEWTKYKVAQMVKADSVARETMRLNSYTNRGLFRKVMVDGIVTEDGIKLPKGAYISFLGHPLQCDAASFEEPFEYDPFRFSRAREAAADREGRPGLRNFSFVSTSPQHLPFGHGNHSCPGRFLVDFELKMIIAYVLMNYDVEFPAEYGGKRPPNRWVAEAFAPPSGAKIRLKRRKASAN